MEYRNRLHKVAYGKTTCTAANLERLEEYKLWEKRRAKLDEFISRANDQPGKEIYIYSEHLYVHNNN